MQPGRHLGESLSVWAEKCIFTLDWIEKTHLIRIRYQRFTGWRAEETHLIRIKYQRFLDCASITFEIGHKLVVLISLRGLSLSQFLVPV